jgi:hypothetical protein
VEQQLSWFKSSYSAQPTTDCVEAAFFPSRDIAVRDSKDPRGPRFQFTAKAWASFTAAVKSGEIGMDPR